MALARSVICSWLTAGIRLVTSVSEPQAVCFDAPRFLVLQHCSPAIQTASPRPVPQIVRYCQAPRYRAITPWAQGQGMAAKKWKKANGEIEHPGPCRSLSDRLDRSKHRPFRVSSNHEVEDEGALRGRAPGGGHVQGSWSLPGKLPVFWAHLCPLVGCLSVQWPPSV